MLRVDADLAPPLSDAQLIDALHGGLPLSDRPFADMADALGLSEEMLIGRLHGLVASGMLSRFGPLYQIERAGGRFVLAAVAVPEARFDDVTRRVNAWPEVAHNYRREHELNMWFVLATERADEVDAVLAAIEVEIGLPVLAFPKEREFFVELRLPVDGAPAPQLRAQQPAPALARPRVETTFSLSEFERALIATTQGGLPLVERPFEAVGAMLGVSGTVVRESLARLLAEGVVRRIGAVPNHYRLGFSANGMTVWDVDDTQVDALGEQVGALPGVSHCYRRPRRLPQWRYNLFAMLHGRSREEVEIAAMQIRALLGDACRAHDILYSSAILKKTGLRLKES